MSHERERRIPRSEDTQEEECRMPFIGPLKGENAAYLVPKTLKAANPRPKGRTAKLMLRQR